MNIFKRWLMKKQKPIHGLLRFDFVSSFPYVCWTSTWQSDEEFPQGFCYKILSGRNERSGMIEAVLVRDLRDGSKEELLRFEAPQEQFSPETNIIPDLESRLSIRFTRIDLSAVRTCEELEERAPALGWEKTLLSH